MKLVKVETLTGSALDWAVAKCRRDTGADWTAHTGHKFSTDWRFGGLIVEQERITLSPGLSGEWWAGYNGTLNSCGPTPLIAAMRCYCCSKVGNEVEIPEDL